MLTAFYQTNGITSQERVLFKKFNILAAALFGSIFIGALTINLLAVSANCSHKVKKK
jgi:hypothetical protein